MRHTLITSLAALALLAGCSKSSNGLSVSASARGTGAATTATAATIDAGNGLSIERLRLLVREFEVEGTPACAAPTGPTGPTGPSGSTGAGTSRVGVPPALAHDGGSGSGSGSGDDGGGGECEIEGGPFLVCQ